MSSSSTNLFQVNKTAIRFVSLRHQQPSWLINTSVRSYIAGTIVNLWSFLNSWNYSTICLLYEWVDVCVCECARACMRVCVCVRVGGLKRNDRFINLIRALIALMQTLWVESLAILLKMEPESQNVTTTTTMITNTRYITSMMVCFRCLMLKHCFYHRIWQIIELSTSPYKFMFLENVTLSLRNDAS